jgi:SAM-dependent methyltransferase
MPSHLPGFSVPPNCHFEVDDAEDPWMFSQQFDYIHGRMLGSCFASHLSVFRSAFDALRPGGWIEMQDFAFPFRCVDDSIKGSGFEKWVDAVLEGCARLGRDWKRVPLYSSYMRECGFVDVHEKLLAWPVGGWAKDEKMKTLGVWNKENVLEGMHGWSTAILTRGLGMSAEEVELMLMGARDSINSRRLHVYVPM